MGVGPAIARKKQALLPTDPNAALGPTAPVTPGTTAAPRPTTGFATPPLTDSEPSPFDATNPGERQPDATTTTTTKTTPTQAPPGFDPDKWANEAHQTPKYKITRITAKYNLADPNERNAAIAEIMAAEPGTQFNGKDKIMLPGTGEGRGVWIDIFGNASGGEYRPQWIDTSYEEGGANYVPPVTAAPGGMVGGAGDFGIPGQGGNSWMTGSSSSSSGVNPYSDQYRQRIAELLSTPLTVDANALAETPEAQAAGLTRQRSEERMRGQLAERAAFDGYSGGAVESEMQGIRQGLAEHEIQMMADLAMQKMQTNREQVLAGIQFAMADGQFDQAQALQRELANLDAAIKRESIRAGLTEGAAERSLREKLGLLGIGYNYDALNATLNQRTAEIILNGPAQ
jgi:hypothetical protein